MPKKRMTDEIKEHVKSLFVKAHIPCTEIGERLGFSRQCITTTLRTMGVNTAKRKVATHCSYCGAFTEKIRSEFRKHSEHFCSEECYTHWKRKPETQAEVEKMRAARERYEKTHHFERYKHAGLFIDRSGDILAFSDRDAVLEWMRTGAPAEVFSVNECGLVTVIYNAAKGRARYVREKEARGDRSGSGKAGEKAGDARGSGRIVLRGRSTRCRAAC